MQEDKKTAKVRKDEAIHSAETVEEKAVNTEQEYSFPEYRMTIKASNLEEAKKKLNEELKKHKTL